MSTTDKIYEGVLYGLSLIDPNESITMDMYKRYTGRVSWYVEDCTHIVLGEGFVDINSKRGSKRIWKEDVTSFEIKMKTDSDVEVVIVDGDLSYYILGKLNTND